jgi:hypothetical protein
VVKEHQPNTKMKRINFIIVFVLSVFGVFGQTQSVQVDTINCIVVNRFHLMYGVYFCPPESFLHYEGDTICFLTNTSWNFEISKRYPDLMNFKVLNDISELSESQRVSDNYDYRTNLWLCKYNKFCRDENGKNIFTSPAFYSALNKLRKDQEWS